ncbi:MAG: (2Fe-2S)-binding protein [Kiritimatiellae bacterium]|nr:(2Fe-2S)-binding protein [Kiritimatiellia bacterium]MDD4735453.1 (2Fe-2S)-binding protein [Kiritimatiellia bacterium]
MNRKTITCKINGVQKEFLVDPDTRLQTVLRDQGYASVKFGCGEGACGACTIIMNGEAVYSCILYAFQADGQEIWTTEGVGSLDKPHPFQQALVEEGAVQCGFCIPGMIMSAKALLDREPDPSEEEIRLSMDGNICRCTGYEKIWTALHKVIAQGKGRES